MVLQTDTDLVVVELMPSGEVVTVAAADLADKNSTTAAAAATAAAGGNSKVEPGAARHLTSRG